MPGNKPLSADHYVNLSNGKFDSTNRAQLDHAIAAWRAAKTQPLIIHFHGGLVNEKSGMEIATRLTNTYADAGGYPLFFVWEAGLIETIRQNLRDIFAERVFQRLLERVTQFAVGKLRQPSGGRGEPLSLPALGDVQDELHVGATPQRDPFAELDPKALPNTGSLEKEEEKQFREELEADFVIDAESEAIANALVPPAETDKQLEKSRGASAKASRHTLMSPEVLDDIRKEAPPPGGRGGMVTTRIIKGAIVVLARVIKRFAGRRDHGLYVTIVEEILHEFYVANVGKLVWTGMKDSTANGFKEDGAIHGGTALLENFKSEWEANNRSRIVLIGHSTGAVYICNLLKHAQTRLPAEMKFDVVFLAPACTFKQFAETLAVAGDRINNIRVFGMRDTLEINDKLVPVVYPRSLLYFVSGVLEDETDMSLVGMERYYSGSAAYDSDFIKKGCDLLRQQASRSIWSVAEGAGGLSTASAKHGDFDNDVATLASLQHIIKSGW